MTSAISWSREQWEVCDDAICERECLSSSVLGNSFKDGFQSVLSDNSTLMFVNTITAHSMKYESIDVIHYEPHTLSLRPFKFFFPTASFIFTATNLFHQVI